MREGLRHPIGAPHVVGEGSQGGGKGIVGLAKVTEGDFDQQGNWVEGRWLNGDEIQLRYDLLYAVDEGYSGQGLNFGRPEPAFLKVELFKY